MALEINKFARRTFYVEGVLITEENMQEAAKWCHGAVNLEVKKDESEVKFIKVNVHRALDERQTRAYVGDMILFAGTGYKVYPLVAFEKTFEPVELGLFRDPKPPVTH